MVSIRRILSPSFRDPDPITAWRLNAFHQFMTWALLALFIPLAFVFLFCRQFGLFWADVAIIGALIPLYALIRRKKLRIVIHAFIAITSAGALGALAMTIQHDLAYLLILEVLIAAIYLGNRASLIWTVVLSLALFLIARQLQPTGLDSFLGTVGLGPGRDDYLLHQFVIPGAFLWGVFLASIGVRRSIMGLIAGVRKGADCSEPPSVEAKLRQFIQEKNEYIRHFEMELEFARRVQQHILPETIPEFEILDVATQYVPAMKVGGDFYDVIPIDNKHVAFLIFDAAGHGIAAALVTAIGRSAFVYHLQQSLSPADILSKVNDHIRSCSPHGIFITAFLLIVDLESKTCRYSNAGHVPPVLYRSQDGVCSELLGGGPPLGALTFTYQDIELQMHERDRVIFYTDGFLDPGCAEQTGFGTSILMKAMQENPAGSSQQIMDSIFRQRGAIVAKGLMDEDDICVVVLSSRRSEFADQVIALLPQTMAQANLNFFRLKREDETNALCAIILKEMDHSGYSDAVIRQMRAVMVELVHNAMHHGNHDDPRKLVKIAYHVDARRTIFALMDQGAGFTPPRLPDPAGQPQPESSVEKGLAGVRQFADYLQFSSTGNCIALVKYRGAAVAHETVQG
jgi:serine phosphatase RsbU (regulator of sigma subunit)/anti-sigma regulatory factor (Ser/Thr protein kinase)